MLMARTGWDPFTEMRRFQAEMNRMLDSVGGFPTAQSYPPVNVWLGDNSVVVTAELPGLSPEDVDVSTQEDVLTIRGERRYADEAGQADWHRRERPYGTFSRTIALPFRVDPNQVQARFQNGLLEVEMQRPEKDRPHKIAINGK